VRGLEPSVALVTNDPGLPAGTLFLQHPEQWNALAPGLGWDREQSNGLDDCSLVPGDTDWGGPVFGASTYSPPHLLESSLASAAKGSALIDHLGPGLSGEPG